MKKFSILFVLTFGVVISMVAQNDDWYTVKDMGSGYRVDFPCVADKTSNNISTAKGPVLMESYGCYALMADKGISFMSSYTEYPVEYFPDGLESEAAQDTFFKGSVNGAVTNLNGKLLNEQAITFNGYPGRRIEIEVINQGATYLMTMWSLLVGYEFYIIQTIEESNSSSLETKKQFFDSFELIKIKGD